MQGKNWIYTLNNPTVELREIWSGETMTYMVGQLEVGESGTPHLQFFIQYKTNKTHKAAAAVVPGCHVERAKSFRHAIAYCKKEDTRKEGPWDFGKAPEPRAGGDRKSVAYCTQAAMSVQQRKLELTPYQIVMLHKAEAIMKAAETMPYAHDDVRGTWYYGKPGSGKSRKAYEENPQAYRKAQNKWWDGYAGEESVILDDMDSGCLGHYLKIWGDRYPCTGEVKGGTVHLQHKRIIITSNYTPEQLWPQDQELQ